MTYLFGKNILKIYIALTIVQSSTKIMHWVVIVLSQFEFDNNLNCTYYAAVVAKLNKDMVQSLVQKMYTVVIWGHVL